MKQKSIIRLNLGCGMHLVSGFINVDVAFDLKDMEEGARTKQGLYQNAVIDKGAKFIRASMVSLPFKDNYADYIEAIDSIEHIGFREVSAAFCEMYRVLKPGGELRIMTTDFNELAKLWVDTISGQPYDIKKYINLMEVIYGNQVGGIAECHKVPFNVDFMAHMLLFAGFKKENIKMTIYPTGTTATPNLQTSDWPEGFVVRTTMIFVEVIK